MYFRCFTATLAVLMCAMPARSQETDSSATAKPETVSATSTAGKPSSPTGSSATAAKASPPKHAIILKDAKPVDGLLRTYRKGNRLYCELSSADYVNRYIVLISIAKGIGREPLYGGMSWNIGDDNWVWSFRKVDDRVHVIRKNVRFRAAKNTPEATAVKNAYTDSVLFSLPILSKGPRGGDLVDFTPIFMSDLPQISQVLPGFSFSPTKSSWASVKGFKDNIELQVAATYASSGRSTIESVADTRGVTINVHYSISKVPQTSYQPRVADDRVGYFVTVVKDYSRQTDDRFLRYINRWNLKKADSSAAKSVPKEPIIFWIEKTVPFKYRKPIYDGISEWNKAFEKAGFINAIEVRQQPDNATWDPEDINYNTFRWITASAGFAMGPSRVNPYTGEILDADIIFDSDFLESWRSKFETLTPATVASLTGGPLDLETYQESLKKPLMGMSQTQRECMLSQGMAMQFAFGRTALLAQADPKQSAKMQEKLIMQGLKEVTMHEVGHTLGLRHNFKSSTFLSLQDLNDPEKTKETGLTASVMDYIPVNIVQDGIKQGDFYSTTIGPYDYWAIEYGYKQLSGGTKGEVAELKKIAARSGEPGHAYATDEDTRGIDPDPFSNRFDLGDDPLVYAQKQAKLVASLMPGIVDRITKDGDDYNDARRSFNVLLATHGQSMFFASRYIGGLDVSRSHKGDKDAPPPFQVIEANQQREALKLLSEYVLSDEPYQIDPGQYNLLAPLNWSHWGTPNKSRADYPVHDVISMWQARILSQLLSSLTLERLHDAELKIANDKDAFTAAELIQELTNVIFSELKDLKPGEYSNRKPAISSLRRNLQRNYLASLSSLAMGETNAPQDCQAIAYAQLGELISKMNEAAKLEGLDSYTKAHLQAAADRALKAKDASLTLYSP
ncbi:MAG: zinc-dependent metalloprotease [Pirellulaceae bacterium]|nr:zinc-dependent metalloprotease [Pirellulaceae bacterium]